MGGFGGAEFAEKQGSPLTWRTNIDYSGLNISTMGIFYEALQRFAHRNSLFRLTKWSDKA